MIKIDVVVAAIVMQHKNCSILPDVLKETYQKKRRGSVSYF